MKSPLALALCAAGCAVGSGRTIDNGTLARDPSYASVPAVPMVEQRGEMDCGAAATAMVLGFWNRPTSVDEVWSAAHPAEGKGIRAGWLRDYLRDRGMQSYLVVGTLTDLQRELQLGHPVVVGTVRDWGNEGLTHYEVVVGLSQEKRQVVTRDPARGSVERTIDEFLREWSRSQYVMVVAWPRS